jgi:hypothetical protein
MKTTDLNEWTYMFSIVKGVKEANIYVTNGMGEDYRVECLFDGDPEQIKENVTLDECREVGENFVMGRER